MSDTTYVPPSAVPSHQGFIFPGDLTGPSDVPNAATARLMPVGKAFADALARLTGGNPMAGLVVYASLWATLLARMSGQRTIGLRFPGLKQGDPEWGIETEPTDAPSVRALLERLRTLVQDGLRPNATPPARGNVGIVYPDALQGAPDPACDLTLVLNGATPCLSPCLRYNPARFSEASATTLGLRLLALSEVWLRPDAVPARCALFLEGERTRLLRGLTEAGTPLPPPRSVHAQVRRWASQSPQAVAAVYTGRTLTYGDLDAESDKVAAYLQKEWDIGVEQVVGLLAEPSAHALITLLGILKAGAAYLPIDPEYPESRIAFMLRDARASLLATTSDHMGAVLEDVPMMVLDFELDGLETPTSVPMSPDADAHTAYITYTSGSTGTPKGVCITHACINRLVAAPNFLTLSPEDRLAQAANPAFDAATFEIWGPLTSGAALIGIPRAVLLDPSRLAGVLAAQRVTVLFLTTALVNTVAQTRPDAFNGLRCLLFGGQAVDPHWISQLQRHGFHGTLLHVYGPTESTTFASWHPVGALTGHESTIPIGGPLSHTGLFVLDAHLEPVPEGVPGELYIGGRGLARGYARRGGLTAARFVPHPFETAPGERLYRTGDRVYRDSNDAVVFLGRFDNQVKVRGFRIELGEVHAALIREPMVADAHVTVRALEPGQMDLVAFVHASSPEHAEATTLRHALEEHLPAYMVPARILFVPKLPLTPNGKVDTQALVALLDLPETSAHTPTAQPETPLQQAICSAFADILDRPSVGLDEDFFDLGGDSLRAIRILARLQEEGYGFAIETLFTHTTARALAETRQETVPIESTEPLPFALITEADRQALPEDAVDAFPPSILQMGMLYHGDCTPGTYQDVLSYEVRGPWDPAIMETVLQTLFARHPMLRASFHVEAYSEPLILIHRRVASAPVVVTADGGPDVCADWRAEEKIRPFVWETAPLLRSFVHVHGADHWTFSLSLHHVLVDGWSVAGLFSEILDHYAAALKGLAPDDTPLLCGYARYIAMERAAASEESGPTFWRNLLADGSSRPLPHCPGLDRPAGQGLHRLRLTDDLLGRLRVVARVAGCHLKHVFAAAHLRVLAFRTGSHDVLTGLVSNGRPEVPDGDRVVGLFLNTLPLRLHLARSTWVELIREVKRLETAMLPHRRLPLPRILACAGQTDTIDHVFNYIDFKRLAPSPDGPIRITRVHVEARSHFDLACTVGPSETEQGFSYVMEYNRARFGDSQIHDLATDYLQVLLAMAEQPLGPMHDTALVHHEEVVRIHRYQAGNRNLATATHDLIARRAETRPQEEVLVYGTRRYTAAQRETAANHAAVRLQALGVRAGTPVGLYLTPSDEAVIALLAVWKAGGTQVPLDPKSPAARIELMLRIAEVALVVVGDQPLPQNGTHTTTLSLQTLLKPSAEPATPIRYENPYAYVMFTSGSTGMPKGVRVFHHNIVRLLYAIEEAAPFSNARVLACAPIAFDASTFEVWGPQMLGGCTVVYPDTLPTVAEVGRLIAAEHITWLFLTTSLFHAFVEDDPDIFAPLKVLLVGGEAASPTHFARVLHQPHMPRPINVYGPTEACGLTTLALETHLYDRVPIGTPLQDTAVYLLDPWGAPTPGLTPGMLYIGGDAPAEGYVGRPRDTAERWLPNPFSGRAGDRMYCSGDTARRLPDGQLDLLGRTDDQVKINGMRMALGEIETGLANLPGITRAVVTLTKGPDKCLVAFYLGTPADETALRDALAKRLPAYMLPHRIVHCDTLPTSVNGKIDRKALASVSPAAVATQPSRQAADPLEQCCVALWTSVLDTPAQVTDNFFALGGNSIQATRLIARARKRLARDIPLKTLFDHPTPERFARALSRETSYGAAQMDFEAFADGPDCLSYSQRRIWFLARMEAEAGGPSAYNIPVCYRLSGQIDADALTHALEDLALRHPMLRTVFPAVNGEPSIRVLDQWALLPMEDLRMHADPETALRQIIDAQAAAPYDLDHGPLFRACLVALPEDAYALSLHVHHILVDGWSIDLLFSDLASLYTAHRNDQPRPPSPQGLPYQAFARAQSAWLEGTHACAQLQWWQSHLADTDMVLRLPTDAPRPTRPSRRGAYFGRRFDAEVTAAIHALSLRLGVTPFTLLLSVYQVLMHKFSGQTRFCVGTPIAGRDHVQLEDMVGCLINSLALKADLSDNPTFETLVQRNQTHALGAFQHAALPFEKLVEGLKLHRDTTRSPVFQTLFVFQNTPGDGDLHLPDMTTSQLKLSTLGAKLDLSLTLVETAEGLSAAWIYNTALFAAATATQMADCFAHLLDRFLVSPDLPVGWAPAHPPAAEAALLAEGRGKEHGLPYVDPVTTWESLVARAPDAGVLWVGDVHLTRDDLEDRANRLAHVLRRRGIREGDTVALLLNRCADLPTALLAVLKCGAAYAPLDPRRPAAYTDRLLAECGARLVLSHQPRRHTTVPHLVLDTAATEMAEMPVTPPKRWSHPHLPAYLICTSGSTGRAKAVVVGFGAMVQYTRGITAALDIQPGSRLAMVSTQAADLGNTMLFPALFGGGALVLSTEEEARDPEAFHRFMATHRPAYLKIVPSHLAALQHNRPVPSCLPTHTLVFGGEVTSRSQVSDILEQVPALRIVNHYGPSEATVGVLTWTHHGRFPDGLGVLPLADPLPRCSTHLLDRHGSLSPRGAFGELCIAGPQLAAGYRGQAAQTAAVFRPDAHAATPGERRYHGGDQFRRTPDGLLLFCGRLDDQVKISGYRVEPGEVTAALKRLPEIRDAVCLAVDGALHAYLAASEDLSLEACRTALRTVMPPPMVPTAWHRLDALPFTPNGKLDRAALTALRPEPSTGHTPPRTPLETKIAAIWAEALGRPGIGVDDDYFALGGHSLMAMKICAALGTVLKRRVPLHLLFAHPTTAALAAALEQEPTRDPATPLSFAGRADVLRAPLSFVQEQLWFQHHYESGNTTYNMPEVLHFEGPLDTEALHDALNHIMARHQVLRTRIGVAGGKPFAHFAPVESLHLPVQTLNQVELASLIQAESHHVFRMEEEPLIRFHLAKCHVEHHVLIMVVHHVIFDGVSLGLFHRELLNGYRARAAGRPIRQPDVPLSYADYALWERETLQGDTLHMLLDWWHAHLEGVPDLLELPLAKPRPRLRVYEGAEHSFRFSNQTDQHVQAFNRDGGFTPYMTLMAAWQTLLYRTNGQARFCVGTPLAGRNHAALDQLIGCFVNTLPVCAAFDHQPSFRRVVEDVRAEVSAVFAHAELPFDKLVAGRLVDRDTSYQPLVQVTFSYNDPLAIPSEEHLRVRREATDPGRAKFDLSIVLGRDAAGLRGCVQYNCSLFTHDWIETLINRFQRVTAELTAHPDRPVAVCPLIDTEERRRLLSTWQGAQVPRRMTLVHHYLEHRAATTPDAPALAVGDRDYGYAQLNGMANAVAAALEDMGVGRGMCIVVCLERGPEFVVVLYALLKLGAAYVPVDPSYPAARIQMILQDTLAPLAVAQTATADAFDASTFLYMMDDLPDPIASNPDRSVDPLDAAYLIYTSGSTGRPKGNINTHAGISNYMAYMSAMLELDAGARFLFKTTHGFDAAAIEYLVPSVAGGRVVIAGPNGHLDVPYMVDLIARAGITHIQFPPSMCHLFLDGLEARPRTPLQGILCSGEELTETLRDRVAALKGPRLINIYGPSECAIATTQWISPPGERGRVPIGRPVDNSGLYVLDRHLVLVPPGVPGELYVAGTPVGRGYFARPGLTAEKYLPNPYADRDEDGRMYRTGDLVRHREDGTLAYLGRLDHMVKIHGIRIEPGDIAACLRTHPAVRDAHVAVLAATQERRLVTAWYTTIDGQAMPESELRTHTRCALPDFMMPHHFLHLTAFPLNPNGKIDAAALPRPSLNATAERVAPDTPTQCAVADIFAEVLDVEAPGIHDNFFSLGGNSLIALQIIARIQDRFHVPLSLQALFNAPTIEQIAALVTEAELASLDDAELNALLEELDT